MMKGAIIDEGKEIIIPMFPRLHVKDAEKGGGPKAPPRNKMALYEQFNINMHMPSQNYASGSSTSLFPLHLRSFTPPSISPYPDDFINTKCFLKTFDGEYAGSAHEGNSGCNLKKNDKDEDKLLKSLNSFREKVNSLVTIELNSTQYEENEGEEVSQKSQEDEEKTHRHYSGLNKPRLECKLGMDISPNDVLGVIGEKQFWKARTAMINQQRIFLIQVFELHRLIKVQKTIARSPHLLLEDIHLLNRTLPKPSPFKRLQSDYVADQSPAGKLANHSENIAIGGKIPLPPCINNISKGHFNNHGHYMGKPTLLTSLDSMNTKNTLSCVYPTSQGNQWLVPVMSPLEGLVYKPIIGPCPPNPSLITPIYGPYSPQHVQEVPTLPPTNSHQRIGSLSDSFSPPMMNSSIEHPNNNNNNNSINNGHENHHYSSSLGEVNSSILYKSSSSNIITNYHTSQIMPRTTNNVPKDKELLLQRSTTSSRSSSPCKKMKGDVLPLFPVAPTFLASNNVDHHHHHQAKVIKALPHNPKSATESAARIFRSIQEERKYL